VGPMHDPSPRAPLVHAVERDLIVGRECREPRGDVDVMGDEGGPPRGRLEDEALVAAAFDVVGEDPNHLSGAQGHWTPEA